MKDELLRPDQWREKQKKKSVVFLPLGPIEWHGPHLPMGTDGLIAQAVADRLSQAFGGVLLPPLFAGAAAPLGAENCRSLGLPEERRSAVGMDFSPIGLPSVYLRETTLEALLLDYTDALLAQGFRLIVLISGHGGAGHTPVLDKLCARRLAGAKIVWYPAILPKTSNDPDSGHATRLETSVMLALNPESVDLQALPSMGEKLSCARYGIADDRFFRGDPTPDKTVFADPRTATRARGEQYLERTIEELSGCIRAQYSALD
ncbi:creatininase family protein [Butyricicoccus faecihominis]|uniref:creatininase family protein n=1 Tax=Butyricicoccus faecihominis TaxID=1712515 RepID=UPI00247AC4CC|nr:creatininase family protein [Butyricicoccus faecihominis]